MYGKLAPPSVPSIHLPAAPIERPPVFCHGSWDLKKPGGSPVLLTRRFITGLLTVLRSEYRGGAPTLRAKMVTSVLFAGVGHPIPPLRLCFQGHETASPSYPFTLRLWTVPVVCWLPPARAAERFDIERPTAAEAELPVRQSRSEAWQIIVTRVTGRAGTGDGAQKKPARAVSLAGKWTAPRGKPGCRFANVGSGLPFPWVGDL